MFALSHSNRRQQARVPSGRPRRGAALIFVMVFVVAMAALAMSSIFMASNANLLAKSYDRERDLKFAAEAALSIGKARVNSDPAILTMRRVGQLDTAILSNYAIIGADNNAIPGIKVNVWVGPTGSTSGQHGRFSSIVAEARDARGNGFIRRLELTQESFAKYAYWSNSETNGSSTIVFGGGDELWGPVWSNDTITIHSTGATFHDEVGTVFFVNGASNGIFSKGKKEYQKPIALPSVAVLNTLSLIAASSGWNFDAQAAVSNTASSVRDRIEFIAQDLSTTPGDSTDRNEGFFRVYKAHNSAGRDTLVRGDWTGGTSTAPLLNNINLCGNFYRIRTATDTGQAQFFPASQHKTGWFYKYMRDNYILRGHSASGTGATSATGMARADTAGSVQAIMTRPGARCFLIGDPHLVWLDRGPGAINPLTNAAYDSLSRFKGGTDTTFTPRGAFGNWVRDTMPGWPHASVTARRPKDAAYLWPIDRSFNGAAKGVIYADGNIGVSGTVNGQITLYAKGSIILLDDIRYATDPVRGICQDILGMISDRDIVIADNALNAPPPVSNNFYFSLDDTKDFYIHGVMMALGNSFRAENHDTGPNDVNDCNGVNNGRGCIYLSGGIIQNVRGPVGVTTGTGYAKRYSYDRCAVINPPPYFPTTGRFADNRYIELDPAGFNDQNYFRSLTPNP